MLNILKRSALFDRLARRPPVLYGRARRLIEAFDAMDAGQREAAQAELLERVLADAEQTGFYAGAGLRDLSCAPLLRKEDVRQAETAFQRAIAVPRSPAATGGTTGAPLRLTRSPGQVVFEQALVDHLIALAGVEPTTVRSAVMRGDAIKPVDAMGPPYWTILGVDRALVSAHHLTSATYPDYERFLETFRPSILHAYPSALEQLTTFAEERGGGPPLRLVFTSSEQLPMGLRARVKAAFGADLLDFYGQAERVCAAWSLRDGEFWFRPDYGAVEFRGGAAGVRLIGTGLHNRAQILLRYDTGDLAALGPHASPERRRLIALGLEPFEGVSGRQSEYIELPDGARIIGLNHVPRGVDGASSIQILQDGPSRVRLRVVPNARYGEATRQRIEANLRLKAPLSVVVDYEIAGAPYRLPNGKAPLFVDLRGRGPSA
ncbi:phenylacetate--CoA ligase family protein [Alsobacter sp. SYSU BS001988]